MSAAAPAQKPADRPTAKSTDKPPAPPAGARTFETIPMTEAQITAAGITIDTVAAAEILTTLRLPGEIRFNEDRTAHVVPRVSGIVEAVPVALGELVRKGQKLAVISSPAVSEQRAELKAAQRRLALARVVHQRERKLWEEKISPEQDVQAAAQAMEEAGIAVANARQKLLAMGAGTEAIDGSLNRFELRAPFDGTIIEKHIALGEHVRDDSAVFTISDLASVWAEVSVPARDLPRVKVGERVMIRSSAFDQSVAGQVSYVGSLIGEQTRTAPARITVSNPDRVWRPGLFVDVDVIADQTAASLTVATDALQTQDGATVVYLRNGPGFLPRAVQTGRSDGQRIEILSGLKAGERYASAGSFVIKSEAGKASATHEH